MSRPGAATTAAFFCVAGAVAGCTTNGEPMAGITRVDPPIAYNDVPIALTITGGPFRAVYRIDAVSGDAVQDPGGFSAFLDPSPTDAARGLPRVTATTMTRKMDGTLQAGLPAGIATGVYDLSVRDPRGTVTQLPRAFTSLGPDHDPPIVVIDSPLAGTLFGANTDVTVTLHADDGDGALGSLRWWATWSGVPMADGACSLAAGARYQPCTFSFRTGTPPTTLEELRVDAEAVDSAGNTGSADGVALRLARRPAVTSIDPRSGPTTGGTPLTVRGMDFVDGAEGTQILLDGQPIGTTFGDSTLLSGVTLPHDPGEFSLTIRTGGADTDAGTFLFVSPPIVRTVSPKGGAAVGGTAVTIVGNNFREGITTIEFDGVPLACPVFVSENRIEGIAPPGAGTVDIEAIDPIGGEGLLAGAFAYDGTLPAGAGCPAPMSRP